VRVGCAILAAGAARRFDRPKPLARIEGVPLLRRIAAAACQSACARVAVVLGADADVGGPTLDNLPVDRLVNLDWPEGMAASVRVAARWADRSGLEALLIATCDQAELATGHLSLLVAASVGGRRLAASAYNDGLGVPAVFPRAFYPRLRRLEGDAGARTILRDPAVRVIPVRWDHGPRDVDTAEDAISPELPLGTEPPSL
jgi:molybdenum cofactor cytidylyltransferase